MSNQQWKRSKNSCHSIERQSIEQSIHIDQIQFWKSCWAITRTVRRTERQTILYDGVCNGGASIYKKREEYESDQFNIREQTTSNKHQHIHTVRSKRKWTRKKQFPFKCSKEFYFLQIFVSFFFYLICHWNCDRTIFRMKEYLAYSCLVSVTKIVKLLNYFNRLWTSEIYFKSCRSTNEMVKQIQLIGISSNQAQRQ